MPISLFPLLSLERIFIYPYFLPGIQALESSAVMLQQIGCCTAVGDSTLLGQVLSNLTFWSTCLNIVQSSLVTVGWYGWVGQDRIFKAALCQIVLANFLAVLHGLSPRQKEGRGWESMFAPERRYLEGRLELQMARSGSLQVLW